MSEGLTEEKMLDLVTSLKKYIETLGISSLDRDRINQLINYFEERLKNIAWEKYQREKGLIPPLLEKKPEVKEV
jgi:hypothetical protein